MNVEREVAGVNGEAAVVAEFELLKCGARPGLEPGPEHAVVDDEEVGTSGCGLAHDGQGGVHGCDDFGDLAVVVFQLKAVEGWGVVGDLGEAQFGVEIGNEVGEIHAGRRGRRLSSLVTMCCFTAKVEEVKNTRIFARLGEHGNQVLIYQMSVNVPQDLAMVLPVPVKQEAGEAAVSFFDFSNYEQVFDDLGSLFPARSYAAGPFGGAAPAGASRTLKVVSVGAYEASFVPTIADFSRLDERFRLPTGVWEKLPGYQEFGFAVFKLRPGNVQVHPMAFSFPTMLTGTVFFPTMHIHDGKIHAKEAFDHTLYLQGAGLNVVRGGWEESAALPVSKVQCGLTHGMIQPSMHVFRQSMRGPFDNGDVVVKVRAA